MTDLNVFYFIQHINAADNMEYSTLRNLPMYQNTIKLFKKTSNRISLTVRTLDRRAIKVSQDRRYYLNILSPDGQYSLLKKLFNPLDVTKGSLIMDITNTEIEHLHIGRYPFSITMVTMDGEFPLYLDSNGAATGEFEIQKYVLPVKLNPFVQFRFNQVRTWKSDMYPASNMQADTFISSRLPISEEGNKLEIDVSGLKGTIKLQITRDLDPNSQLSWNDFMEFNYTGAEDITEEIDLPANVNTFYRVLFTKEPTNEGDITELRYY